MVLVRQLYCLLLLKIRIPGNLHVDIPGGGGGWRNTLAVISRSGGGALLDGGVGGVACSEAGRRFSWDLSGGFGGGGGGCRAGGGGGASRTTALTRVLDNAVNKWTALQNFNPSFCF